MYILLWHVNDSTRAYRTSTRKIESKCVNSDCESIVCKSQRVELNAPWIINFSRYERVCLTSAPSNVMSHVSMLSHRITHIHLTHTAHLHHACLHVQRHSWHSKRWIHSHDHLNYRLKWFNIVTLYFRIQIVSFNLSACCSVALAMYSVTMIYATFGLFQ